MSTSETHEQTAKKVRLTVLIEPEQRQRLEELYTATGAPFCEIVRRSLDSYLNHRERVSA